MGWSELLELEFDPCVKIAIYSYNIKFNLMYLGGFGYCVLFSFVSLGFSRTSTPHEARLRLKQFAVHSATASLHPNG